MINNIDYNKKVLEYFRNPRNMGEMKNPDAEATVRSPQCRDVMKIMLRIKGNWIEDIKFQTFGCAAAIATSSMLTEMVGEKTLKEAKKISNADIVKALGGLPSIKIHCSNLGVNTLRKAIENWERRK